MRIIISNIFGAKYEEKIGQPRLGEDGRLTTAMAASVPRVSGGEVVVGVGRESETHPAFSTKHLAVVLQEHASRHERDYERQVGYLRYAIR